MACCLLCFDESPVSGGERNGNARTWRTGMKDAGCNEPLCCCAGALLPCCTQYSLRKEALGGSLENYLCCQGYFDCAPCFVAGNCGEQSSPEACLCVESFCCVHFATQVSLRLPVPAAALAPPAPRAPSRPRARARALHSPLHPRRRGST